MMLQIGMVQLLSGFDLQGHLTPQDAVNTAVQTKAFHSFTCDRTRSSDVPRFGGIWSG